MEQKTMKRLYFFLPWVLTFVLLGAFTLYSYYRGSSNPFETEFIKSDLLSTMRIHLLEAVEAEKNAVMANTDEASEYFTAQSRQATADAENNRKEIEAIIHQGKLPKETEILNEFNICWLQFRKLDETILDLATQNSNLKAQKISSKQCAQEMEHFEESLSHLIHRNMNNKQCNEAVMFSYKALTGGLKIFALHRTHIDEADDQKMDKIEQSIQSYDESARKALGSLHIMANPSDSVIIQTLSSQN